VCLSNKKSRNHSTKNEKIKKKKKEEEKKKSTNRPEQKKDINGTERNFLVKYYTIKDFAFMRQL
jgi:hypothetical protein